MLEALYTGSSTWITQTALTPYVTNTSLTNTLTGYMLNAGGTFTGDIFLDVHSLKCVNTYAVTRTIDQAMLETLFTCSSTKINSTGLSNDLSYYMPKDGGTFIGDISLNIHSLKFMNVGGLTRVINQAMLETPVQWL